MSVSPNAVPGDRYLGGLFMFLCRAIREHLFLTVLLPLVAAAIAYVAVLQLPPVYTAQGNVRIGRVDGTETMGLTGVVSRLNSPSFKLRVIEAMGLPSVDRDRAAQLIFQSLAAKQETADTLAVTVRATGAQQARDAAATAVRLLDEEQRKTREPLEADIKEQLATNDATITGLLETRDSLSALMKENGQGASIDPTSLVMRRVWLADLISRNEQRLTAAKAERHALSAKLGVWKTYPTTLLDDVFVLPGFAVRPATMALLAGGAAFMILLLGVVLRGSKAVRAD
ncbi:hypothetical protein IVB22_04710 [Bradyrhizobium sp. 190]|uniref:hypothetical protein n=1 Tax=Bradyrhizobium sp. 190 TaxID=2782658 RepID=UPI001FF864A8|nr:hypothetical protein [Bradyrhizobium sp. 190]MCK1511875.1 hypothetical protein [Bradyrhizobium sp. 190]